mmetsp:Transcript_131871/g.381403  ORF Transcript_131871/g.381403 Transcript_131871/m.381403 type:complete len:212 (-) Transcript_131871:494-1129(-)
MRRKQSLSNVPADCLDGLLATLLLFVDVLPNRQVQCGQLLAEQALALDMHESQAFLGQGSRPNITMGLRNVSHRHGAPLELLGGLFALRFTTGRSRCYDKQRRGCLDPSLKVVARATRLKFGRNLFQPRGKPLAQLSGVWRPSNADLGCGIGLKSQTVATRNGVGEHCVGELPPVWEPPYVLQLSAHLRHASVLAQQDHPLEREVQLVAAG